MNRMVTKGYRKGVYERVSKGIVVSRPLRGGRGRPPDSRWDGGATLRHGSSMNVLFGRDARTVYFSEGEIVGNRGQEQL